MIRVVTFGSFDPLHEGHRWLFKKAREQGDHLAVVVARDSTIAAGKQRTAHQPEEQRRGAVAAEAVVDEAVLGDADPGSYNLLTSLDFSVLVLGYDQQPGDEEVKQLLAARGLTEVRVHRLPPYQPETHKSTLLRS